MKAFLIVILAVFGIFWYLFSSYGGIFGRNLSPLSGSSGTEKALTQIVQQVLAPPPLRATKDAPTSFLDAAGVVARTNKERELHSLSTLARNTLLDQVALLKVEDMFARQYFAHDSPSGEGADDLARTVGYAYIVIGENLALGNYENNTALVAAWMASPGHRANILHERFQEIGVAVKRGVFEGKSTWLAVQEFGMPTSACPQPDITLKARIAANEAELKTREAQLVVLRTELENEKNRKEFRDKAEMYNVLVEEYNALVKTTKSLVDRYNAQVQATNVCIAG